MCCLAADSQARRDAVDRRQVTAFVALQDLHPSILFARIFRQSFAADCGEGSFVFPQAELPADQFSHSLVLRCCDYALVRVP